MFRQIDDADYISYLPTNLHRRRYERWKAGILNSLEEILGDFRNSSVEEVMNKYGLTPKDIALLVRLGFVTKEEAEEFNLYSIEKMVPI